MSDSPDHKPPFEGAAIGQEPPGAGSPGAPSQSGGPTLGFTAPPQLPPQLAAALFAQLAARGGLPYAGVPMGTLSPAMMTSVGALQVQVQQRWEGQFPPPAAVAEYEKILPGSFNRMIAMAEQGQRAQIAETERAQAYTRDDSRRGQLLGFAALICAMLAGLICVGIGAFTQSNDAFYISAVFLSPAVMAVAWALVDSARASRVKAKLENALLAAETNAAPGTHISAESPRPPESPTP